MLFYVFPPRTVLFSSPDLNSELVIIAVMYLLRVILYLACILPLPATVSCSSHMIATALVSEPDGDARIECWRFEPPLHSYPNVGAAVTVAEVSNVTYVVLPPRSSEGIHNPPYPMLVHHMPWGTNMSNLTWLRLFVLLSGLAHVTLPHSDNDVWIMEGVNVFLVAADVTGNGHYTDYPSDKETVALQLPFRDGKVPAHDVLHTGACKTFS